MPTWLGRNLEVGGYLYAKDFPEIVDEVAKPWTEKRESSPIRWVSRFQTAGGRLEDFLGGCGGGDSQLDCDRARGRLRSKSSSHLASRSRRRRDGSGLGMSFEVTNVELAGPRRQKIWTLTEVTFTGAAILRKDKAAYQDTWIELS